MLVIWLQWWGRASPDPCDGSWLGITCDASGYVVYIIANNSGLTGHLPRETRNLSMLAAIYLNNNSLSGDVPPLGPNLMEISLSYNRFMSISPEFFKDMEIVFSLSAVNANIIGPIPEFMGDHFKYLGTLKLQGNSLFGHIPTSFASTRIRSVQLQDQRGLDKLSGPIFMLNATNIVYLDLHGNQFTGPIPNLASNIEMEYIDLSKNALTGDVPQSLMQLHHLRVLNL
uniref:Leucine-rich repeat-containing N-terminal plant-type domain-containing protein n=1 Tax=Oryza barthii TaxID=65489 RepID=A0A0D3G3D8_9ORYZ